MKIIKWFKTLFYIVKHYENHKLAWQNAIAALTIRAEQAEKVIRDRTDLHADIHHRGENWIILIGRHKGRDYIQTFSTGREDFDRFVFTMRDMCRYAQARKMDCPPQMKAVVEHEFGSDQFEREDRVRYDVHKKWK